MNLKPNNMKSLRTIVYKCKANLGNPVLVLALMVCMSFSAVAEQVDGKLNWDRKVQLSTPVSGIVSSVAVQPGDKVKKGDALITLEQSVFAADLEFAKADLKYKERLNKEAKQELDRNIELYDRTVLSNHELEAAHIIYEKNIAELMQAKKYLAQAEFNAQYSIIKAPFDGVVLTQNVTEGQTIVSTQSAPTLMELAASDAMVVEFAVNGASLRKLSIGKKVGIQFGGRKFKAPVVAIDYEPMAKSNRYLVKAKFATRGRSYRAGRGAKVDLP